MILHCPHPEPLHDHDGRCAVRSCACEIIVALTRCACPYQDCYVPVPSPGDVCAACGPCLKAFEMDRP